MSLVSYHKVFMKYENIGKKCNDRLLIFGSRYQTEPEKPNRLGLRVQNEIKKVTGSLLSLKLDRACYFLPFSWIRLLPGICT